MDAKDAAFIERCERGDTNAWEALVQRYTRLVYSVPRKYRFGDQDCDDVHQAVFAALINNISRLRNSSALPSWLITTAHRECWRIGRSRVRNLDTEFDFASVGEPREDVASVLETRHRVRQGLDLLGGTCRELLLLLFASGSGNRSYDSIGAELKMSPGSIGPTRARCLAKLGEILRSLGISDVN